MYFFQHDVADLEGEYTLKAIQEGHITTGVWVKKFEEALRDKFRLSPLAFANSGTSAIHLALLAAGVKPGDEVITTPYVGVWTSNPILMCGAVPVYADIERHTYNLDAHSVAERLTERTKAVLPVSTFGNPVDMEALRAVLPSHVRIISDDIEALGSTRKGTYVGEKMGTDVSVGGFWVSKQVTAGGMGGMVATDDMDFLDRFARLTRHGHGLVGDMWNQSFGYNLWLPDPMAAFGVAQVLRYDEKQERLLKVKHMLDLFFGHLPRQVFKAGYKASEFIYCIELPKGVKKLKFSEEMAKLGVPTRPYFNSLLQVPHLKQYAIHDCSVAEEVASRTIALPYHWKLTLEEVAQIADAYHKVLTSMGVEHG